ncbi:MAG: 3-phosphoshikimate 1-carboxyvinyltransferase [Alphaproteobacteria bacterium]|nr:3-phosphoshikimate 1-carboxyvinyltransferase [Alphaproteobacteria bacterium]
MKPAIRTEDAPAVSRPVAALRGIAAVPGDKSVSHRALMLAAIAEGETLVTGLLEGEDVLHTAAALRAMDAEIEKHGDAWRIRGVAALRQPAGDLYLGNSGTSARLLAGLVSGYPVTAVFTGDASLSRRPMQRVTLPLAQMGAKFEDGTLPLRVRGGNLQAIRYTLPVASAQVKSAILLAGLNAAGETIVLEPAPTRDHTERMLKLFGAEIAVDGAEIRLKGGQKLKSPGTLQVPADPSAAAFPIVAALITRNSDITVPNVMINPRRDGFYKTLLEMGADIAFENRRRLSGEEVADIRARSSRLKGVAVPPQRVPSMIDEFPILGIAAAFAEGETEMTGLAELRVKESDRLAAIAEMLAGAGVKCQSGEDSLRVTGGTVKGGSAVKTHLDHRIAMSALVLGMNAAEPVAIDSAGMIATSFPGFIDLMNGLGAEIGAL